MTGRWQRGGTVWGGMPPTRPAEAGAEEALGAGPWRMRGTPWSEVSENRQLDKERAEDDPRVTQAEAAARPPPEGHRQSCRRQPA